MLRLTTALVPFAITVLAIAGWFSRPGGYFRPADVRRDQIFWRVPPNRPDRLRWVVQVPGIEADRPYWEQGFEIEIDPSGHPVSLKYRPLPYPEWIAPSKSVASAIAQIRTWTFTPFRVDNHPVYARFVADFTLAAVEDRPSTHIPFPQVIDLNKVVMTYYEGGGMSRAPRYIAIHGDGQVDVDGFGGYGHHRPSPITISKEQVLSLIDTFRRADFFSLRDTYFAPVTEANDKITSITINGQTKTIREHVGEQGGLPEAVIEVEDAIQRAGGFEP